MDVGSQLSRRGFLLGVAAGAALAGCTPGRPAPGATASPGPTAGASASAGGSGRLGVAVVGAGGQGQALTRRLVADRRVRVVAVCDPDVARARLLTRRVEQAGHPTPAQLGDLRMVVDDPRVDAVVVATPHHWHVLAALWALAAGRHVYLEKPATHNLAEGEFLLAAARSSGLVVEVGTQRRSHPGLQEALADLHDGIIGRVEHAHCYSWKRRRPIGPPVRGNWPATVDAPLWFGPRPVSRPTRGHFHYDWHWFYDYGNGGLGNNGVHRLDVALWGLRPSGPMTATLALAGRLGPADAGETPNTALTVIGYGATTVAHDLRGLPTAPDNLLDEGMEVGDEVVFAGDGPRIVVNRVGGRLVDERGRVVRQYGRGVAGVDPLARHLRGFVTASLAGDPDGVQVGPAEGVAAAAACHAATAAHRAGEASAARVDLDAVHGEIETMCGSVMGSPTESFLAHVGRDGVPQLRFSGIRRVEGSEVQGAHQTYAYRDGYRLAE